ncbi:MAG: hypothetical protein MUE79_00975 [Nitratireductor sp.]|nr:hypothetical protein [Nitratireductor sp.]
MCETPLELRFMLAETEGRARALAKSARSEDAAVAGAWRRLVELAGRLRGAWPIETMNSRGPAGRRGGFKAAG